MVGYLALGSRYGFGENFFYELPKDALAYGLFVAGIALVEHLLRQQQLIQTPGQSLTFDGSAESDGSTIRVASIPVCSA